MPVATRITSAGRAVRLCQKCDAVWGDTIGVPGEDRACTTCGDSFQVAAGSENKICASCTAKYLAEFREALVKASAEAHAQQPLDFSQRMTYSSIKARRTNHG